MDQTSRGTDHTWTARRVRPVMAVYVLGVFGGFMIVSHFIFHSPEAVKALAVAAIGGIASLAPSILTRIEYRLNDVGVAKRPRSEKVPREFKEVFRWEELDHVLPTRSGFKYFKELRDPNAVLRFLKLHFSGDHSGEIHVEAEDREEVNRSMRGKGVPIRGPVRSRGVEGGSKVER